MRSLVVCVALVLLAAVRADEPAENLKPSQIADLLSRKVSWHEIKEPMTLRLSIERLNVILARQKLSLKTWINMNAFKEEAAEAPELMDVVVSYPDRGPRPTIHQILTEYCDQVPGRNATFFIRPGHIEITTRDRAMIYYRLDDPVRLRVHGRPLFLVLDDLYEQTGVSIVVDSRAAARARTAITATLDGTLNDALKAVLHMTDLRYVTIGKIVFVTTPEHAYRILLEQRFQDRFNLDPRGPFIGRLNAAQAMVNVATNVNREFEISNLKFEI